MVIENQIDYGALNDSIPGMFMKVMQQHYHSTIYCKVKGITPIPVVKDQLLC